MRYSRMIILAVVLSFLFAGCSGKAVPTGELPCSDVQTRVQKSNSGKLIRFDYCLLQEKPGSYTIQGNTHFDTLGSITDTRLYLVLVKDSKMVKRIPLQVRATAMDKTVYFYKEFEYGESFDFVAFDWHFKYRF